MVDFSICLRDAAEEILKQHCEIVCFDSSKFLENFGNSLTPWCVRTLYGLSGIKVENLNLLSKQIFANDYSLYHELYEKMMAHLASYRVANIPVEKYQILKLFPNNLLSSFYREKCTLIYALFGKISDPDIRKFYKSFYKTVDNLFWISRVGIAVDEEKLKSFDNHHAVAIARNVKDGILRLKLNPVGAKTGRITCKKDTANIFALPKDMRSILKARPGYKIVQYDFKAFQPRIAISCVDDEKIRKECSETRDIYSLMPGKREDNKLEFLEWIFAKDFPSRFSEKFHSIVQLRNQLFSQACETKKIVNKFGRVLPYHGEMKNVVFQNYITSNEADAIFGIIDGLRKFLQSTKSHILFPFHDAIVCEIHESEEHLIDEIQNILENFYVCEKLKFFFPVEVKKGENFGSLF